LNITKQKLLEILITALLSAGIAFLQGLLQHTLNQSLPTADPVVAGGIGALIRGVVILKYV
jgi:hypothetical protein